MTLAHELDAAGIDGAALREGYARCRALSREHGRTYHLATLLLPPAKRPFVHALYGLARYTDDIVDEHPRYGTAQRAAVLEDWTHAFLQDLEWGAAGHPVARAAVDTMTRWEIPGSYVADFFASMRADLTVTAYATYDDLNRYMWGSAAVIGLQMLPILGRRDDSVRWDELEPPAIALGTAFQLTNFLRDVADDLRRGRVYLPQSSLDQFGVTRDRLARAVFEQRGVDEPLRNLMAWEIERARALYAQAAPGVALVDPSSRDCLQSALTLYSEILDEIEAADYDVFSGRVRVGNARRAQVGLTGLARAVRARRAPTASA